MKRFLPFLILFLTLPFLALAANRTMVATWDNGTVTRPIDLDPGSTIGGQAFGGAGGDYASFSLIPPAGNWTDVVLKCSVDDWATMSVLLVTADPLGSLSETIPQSWLVENGGSGIYPDVRFADSGYTEGRKLRMQGGVALADALTDAESLVGGVIVRFYEELSSLRDNSKAEWVCSWRGESTVLSDVNGRTVWIPVEPKWGNPPEAATINLNDGLALYLSFDDNGPWGNEVGNGTFVSVGSVTKVSGFTGNAIRVYGNSSYVKSSNATMSMEATPLTANYTISCWVNFAAVPPPSLQCVWTDRWNDSIGFSVPQNTWYGMKNHNYFEFPVSESIESNQWVHLVVVGDGPAGVCSLWVNGLRMRSAILDAPHGMTHRHDWRIGCSNDGGNNAAYFMNGTVDEYGAWDRVLTPYEIRALYNEGNGLPRSEF